jgi:hypothetical protein
MLRIVRDDDGTVHLQLIAANGVFELEPTDSDRLLPDGLYDDHWNPISDGLQSTSY